MGPTPALAESGELSDSLVTPTATAPMLAAHMFFISASANGVAQLHPVLGSSAFFKCVSGWASPNVI